MTYDVWEHLLLDKKKGISAIYNLDQERVRTAGIDLWKHYSHKTHFLKNGWEELEKQYWTMFNEILGLSISIDNYIRLTDDFIKPVEGMLELLEELRRKGVILSICSNNTEFWFERQMKKLKLSRFMNTNNVVISSRVGVSKSSISLEMFRESIRILGVRREYCVFIDDKERNVEQALKYGIPSIIFPSHSPNGALYLKTIFEKMKIL